MKFKRAQHYWLNLLYFCLNQGSSKGESALYAILSSLMEGSDSTSLIFLGLGSTSTFVLCECLFYVDDNHACTNLSQSECTAMVICAVQGTITRPPFATVEMAATEI